MSTRSVSSQLFSFCCLFQPLQLRLLYNELKPLLAVDFVASLPKELVERIFSYLSVESLCRVALCSKLWRERSNHNPIWLGVRLIIWYFMDCVAFLILYYYYEEFLSMANPDQLEEGNNCLLTILFSFLTRLAQHLWGFGINPCRPSFH